MILGGLPVVVGLLLALTSPAYLRPLLTDIRGLMLDGLALVMLGTGITIMIKMAKFEIRKAPAFRTFRSRTGFLMAWGSTTPSSCSHP